jgi:hypothetical protein
MGDFKRMKKSFAAFCLLSLCSLLLVNAATVKASTTSGFVRVDYPTQVTPTIDGAWDPADEWSDTNWTVIGEDVAFGSTWDFTENVYSRWFIDFFADETDDPGDYFEMCIDWNNAGGATLGDTTSYRIHIEDGVFTLYQGEDSDWTEITPSDDPADLEWATAINTSPNGTSAHRIWEMNILKNAGTGLADMYWGVRVAVYDETADALFVWPPDSASDVPDEWGMQDYTSDPWIPESFSIVIVVLLSSVAVAVGFYCLRKQSRTESYNSAKTGKIGYLA